MFAYQNSPVMGWSGLSNIDLHVIHQNVKICKMSNFKKIVDKVWKKTCIWKSEICKIVCVCVCVCGEDILEYLGYISKVFAIDSSMVKLMLKLDFIIWSLILKDHKWVVRSKLIWVVNLNLIYGDWMWKHENIYLEADRSELLVLFGLKSCNTVGLINWSFSKMVKDEPLD